MVDDKELNHQDVTTEDASVAVFIQARMGSTRLPGKCMKLLAGKPIIDWVLEGVSQSAHVDGIVVCIPNTEKDELLKRHLQEKNIEVFSGSEDDVLGRFSEAARTSSCSHILRVTADCPLISGPQLDVLIEHYFAQDLDYAYNHIPSESNFYPDGIGGELFSKALLLEIEREATLPAHREHVTLFVRENPQRFTLGGPTAAEEIRFPTVKLDVDTAEDFAQIESLLSALSKESTARPSDTTVCEKYLELFSW